MQKQAKHPLVSICIPAYNSADYIRYTLDSVISQTYKNTEIIVIDNASTDATGQIIQEDYVKHGVKYFRSTSKKASENWNSCIDLAAGDYIAIYHSDDIYDKCIIEREVEVLGKDPKIGAVFTGGEIINDKNNIMRKIEMPRIFQYKETVKSLDSKEAFQSIMNYGCYLICSSAMVRKDVYNKIGNFNTKGYLYALDLDMWIRIMLNYKIAIINTPLIKYRVHRKQGTAALVHSSEKEEYKIIDKYINEFAKGSLNFGKYDKRRGVENVKIAMRIFAVGPDKSIRFITELPKKKYIYACLIVGIRILRVGLFYKITKMLINIILMKKDRERYTVLKVK